MSLVKEYPTPDHNRTATIPHIQVECNSRYFPKPPLPLPGVDMMPIAYPDCVAVSPQSRRPTDIMRNYRNSEPYWQDLQEFQQLLEAYEKSSFEIKTKRNKVREKLFEMKLMGHSVSSKFNSPKEQLSGAYNIMRFGLWPEYNHQENRYLPYPWIGYFGDPCVAGDAGAKFYDIAFIPHFPKENFVQIPIEYGAGTFIPLTEMTMIVPTKEIKEAFIALFRSDVVAKHTPETLAYLEENILTYQDILEMQ